MNKLGAVIVIVALVGAAYLFLLAGMPVITDMVSSANATITASSNLTNYPGSQGFLVSTPWIMFFVPAAIGIAAIIFILKKP